MAECIYNWIKEESAAPRKPQRYKSKYDPKAPLAASTFRKEERVVGTFGRNVRGTVKPSEYLKAGERCGRGIDPSSKRMCNLSFIRDAIYLPVCTSVVWYQDRL